MSTLSIPCISRAYAARGARHLLANRRLTTALNPQRRYLADAPATSIITHTRHDPNRVNPRRHQGLHLQYFSSASPLDGDDDGKADGDGGADASTSSSDDDGDANALKVSIERLKAFRHESSDGEKNTTFPNDNHLTPKVELVNVTKSMSSSFETPFHKEHSSNSLSSGSHGEKDVQKKKKPPNLSDLLSTDIFTESWSEQSDTTSADDTNGRNTGYQSRGGNNNNNNDYYSSAGVVVGSPQRSSYGLQQQQQQEQQGNHSSVASSSSRRSSAPPPSNNDAVSSWSYSSSDSTFDTATTSSTLRNDYSDNDSLKKNTSTSSSPAQIEFNKLLEQTNELLNSLSNNEDDDDSSLSSSSTTLQLQDFDKVMTQWSKFHSQVDSRSSRSSSGTKHTNDESNNGGHYNADNRGDNDVLLKTKASDECTKLLNALEYNYDCILAHAHHHSTTTDEPPLLPQTKHAHLMPNAASYNLALHTLAHSDKKNGKFVAQEACSLLMRMLDRCQRYMDLVDTSNGDDNDDDDDGVPDLPEGWVMASSSSTPTSKKQQPKAVKLPPPFAEPTIITFNSVVHAIAKSGASDAGHLAEEVFGKMDWWNEMCADGKSERDEDGSRTAERRTHSYGGVRPNARTLACVIDAWAICKTAQHQSFGPERAEAILELAVQRRRDYVNVVMGRAVRDDDSFHDEIIQDEISLDSLDDDRDVEEEEVEEELIDEELMMTTEEPLSVSFQPVEATAPITDQDMPPSLPTIEMTTPPPLKPNVVAFNTCIHAWATSNRGREGALRAQELLAQLEALSESDELDLPSNHDSSSVTKEDGDGDDSLKPNVLTYSMVMNAWANVAKLEQGSGEDAAVHCESILTKMEERGAIDASVRPNLVVYVTAISAWARTKNVEYAASRAERILNRMIDLYYDETATKSDLPQLDGDVENARHDAPFNSVITAYARSSDPYAAERALAVLERLEASPIITPTTTSYNAVMDVCAKHGEPERALEVFRKMEENVSMDAADSTSYDTVLNAFARCEKEGSAERAYDFLCQLEADSSKNNFSPSSLSYSTVLNAFARASGNREYGGLHNVTKAKEIYDKLIEHMKDGVIYGEPDSFANACFLNCCANVYGLESDKKEVLVIAINAFEEMKKRPDLHAEPNQYTFGTMMKVCTKLSSDTSEKNRLMEHLFKQACHRGLVSKAVLGQFLRHTPSQLSMKTILSQGGTKREIPHSWHSNVPRRQWPTPMENGKGYY